LRLLLPPDISPRAGLPAPIRWLRSVLNSSSLPVHSTPGADRIELPDRLFVFGSQGNTPQF
jgi:hypothetical protein